MTEELIKAKVDEFVKWSKMLEDCKHEIEVLKGDFTKLGEVALKDKKNKQVEFWGNENAKVVVTKSEKLVVEFPTILTQTFGELLKEYSKEKVTYDYSEPFKHVLISICQGSYLDQHLSDVIRQIPVDDETGKVLSKKLKGNWKKDIDTLMNTAGFDRTEAEQYAFLYQESINYERILRLLKAAGHEPGSPLFGSALDTIKTAVVVEEGIKVGIEAEGE